MSDYDLWLDDEDECEGAPDPANDEPCSRRCGYVDQGQGLLDRSVICGCNGRAQRNLSQA